MALNQSAEGMEEVALVDGSRSARLSDSDIIATHLARHMIQSISAPDGSASVVSEIDVSLSHSQLVQSLTQNILANHLLDSGSMYSQVQPSIDSDVPVLLPGLVAPQHPESSRASNRYSISAPSGAAEEVVRDVIVGASLHDALPANSKAESSAQVSQDTDSVVAQSITRNLILNGMDESNSGSQSRDIPEEALSEGYAANSVAREVIASATLQDVPPQGTAASSHIDSEGADGQIMNLVAQHSAIPHAKSLPNDLVEEARSDADGGEEVQAMLRQTIGGVGSQSGHIPEEALSDGYAANGVAREVIASATLQDVPPQGTAASSHIDSEGADGQIMNLVAQHSAIPHAKSLPNDLVEEARSDADGGEEVQAMLRQTIGGVGSQSGHIPEEALSDGYAANGVAREVIASATLQDVPPQGTAASSHIDSEGADGQIMNLVAQHSAIPHAKSLPNDLVEEARSMLMVEKRFKQC